MRQLQQYITASIEPGCAVSMPVSDGNQEDPPLIFEVLSVELKAMFIKTFSPDGGVEEVLNSTAVQIYEFWDDIMKRCRRKRRRALRVLLQHPLRH